MHAPDWRWYILHARHDKAIRQGLAPGQAVFALSDCSAGRPPLTHMVGAGFASALDGKFEKVELDPASIDPASFKTIDTRRRMFPQEEATAGRSPRDIDGHARFPGPLPAWDDDPVDPAGPRSSSGISATSKECAMATRSVGESAAKRSTKSTALPDSMVSGKASAAKAAVGDQPVFAYIAGLPQPQRGIAERIDQLAAASLPGLQRSVKWGMAYYGIGDGWCFSCGAFAGHVKLMFVNGSTLVPVPPVTPLAMGKSTRGIELASLHDLDEQQVVAWMRQITAMPGVGKRPQKK